MNLLAGLALILVFILGYLITTSAERKFSILDSASGCGCQIKGLFGGIFSRLSGVRTYYSYHRRYTQAIKRNNKLNGV